MPNENDVKRLVDTLNDALHPDRQHLVVLRQGFLVMGNDDSVEGKGAPKIVGAALRRDEAEKKAKGAGPSGGDAYLVGTWFLAIATPREGSRPGDHLAERFLFPVSSVIDLRPGMTARERALAKLSPEDRAALGIRE